MNAELEMRRVQRQIAAKEQAKLRINAELDALSATYEGLREPARRESILATRWVLGVSGLILSHGRIGALGGGTFRFGAAKVCVREAPGSVVPYRLELLEGTLVDLFRAGVQIEPHPNLELTVSELQEELAEAIQERDAILAQLAEARRAASEPA